MFGRQLSFALVGFQGVFNRVANVVIGRGDMSGTLLADWNCAITHASTC